MTYKILYPHGSTIPTLPYIEVTNSLAPSSSGYSSLYRATTISSYTAVMCLLCQTFILVIYFSSLLALCVECLHTVIFLLYHMDLCMAGLHANKLGIVCHHSVNTVLPQNNIQKPTYIELHTHRLLML